MINFTKLELKGIKKKSKHFKMQVNERRKQHEVYAYDNKRVALCEGG
jgi:hypothetical protein